MNKDKMKKIQRSRRRGRIRTCINGTKECPRFSVFRSNTGMFVQLIDDRSGRTLASAHSREVKVAAGNNKKTKSAKADDKNGKKGDKGKKDGQPMSGRVAVCFELGKLIARKASDKKINRVVFDRGGYKYHGRIRAVADGAREGGLKF